MSELRAHKPRGVPMSEPVIVEATEKVVNWYNEAFHLFLQNPQTNTLMESDLHDLALAATLIAARIDSGVRFDRKIDELTEVINGLAR